MFSYLTHTLRVGSFRIYNSIYAETWWGDYVDKTALKTEGSDLSVCKRDVPAAAPTAMAWS